MRYSGVLLYLSCIPSFTQGLTLSNSTAKSNRRISNSSSASSSSNVAAPSANAAGSANAQQPVTVENDSAAAAATKKTAPPTHVKINLPGGMTATGNLTHCVTHVEFQRSAVVFCYEMIHFRLTWCWPRGYHATSPQRRGLGVLHCLHLCLFSSLRCS